MELPNNTRSSEAAKQMEFAEGFNPELTTEEKLRAAAEFDDLVWLTLLRFAGDAKTYDHTESMDRVESQVLLEIPQKDGSYILVSVESALLDNGDKERSISIMEWDEGSKETHDYYIEDDQVLRYDDNIAELSRELSGVLRPEESISIKGMKRALDMCRNEVENCKLEQQMGLNRQPVGVEEINKLAKLLESARPRK
ncbi:hypothetical protein EUA68_01040 [TM7 phylum sp. oral taxon 352]|jgi:hypothetical protein|nr:hypothetical protein EUA68_01040 [TM7 phylum sp. oral taxon 352]